jgi:hypothetical protein
VKRPGTQREKQKHEKARHSSSVSGVTGRVYKLAHTIWDSHRRDAA